MDFNHFPLKYGTSFEFNSVLKMIREISLKDHKPTNSYHYNTIDGHFNNLNCITSTVAHIFTAGITGTLGMLTWKTVLFFYFETFSTDTRDPTVYSSMFEQFLSDLVFNMRQYGICKNMAVNKREEPMMKINYESVLLLIRYLKWSKCHQMKG